LEDHADAVESECAALGWAEEGEVVVEEVDVAAGGWEDAADEVEEGSFTAAAGADDGADLAGRALEGGDEEGEGTFSGAVVGEGNVREADQRLGCHVVVLGGVASGWSGVKAGALAEAGL
jgi:hypothetical protein